MTCKWYCDSCGCIGEAKVTYDETCESCGDPVYWESVEEKETENVSDSKTVA